MANASVTNIQNDIIEAVLPQVVFDGWSEHALETAANLAGYDPDTARAVFPEHVTGAVDGFARWVDDNMMEKLALLDVDNMRVRDRIRAAVLARLQVLEPYKEAERYAVAYWSYPTRSMRAARIVWRTADRIWDWAGDTATDYNRYTKRGLLSGILVSTTLAWLNDDSHDMTETEHFLERRIDDVMQIGKAMGKIKR